MRNAVSARGCLGGDAGGVTGAGVTVGALRPGRSGRPFPLQLLCWTDPRWQLQGIAAAPSAEGAGGHLNL